MKTDKELTVDLVTAYVQACIEKDNFIDKNLLIDLIKCVHKQLCELPDTRHEYLTHPDKKSE